MIVEAYGGPHDGKHVSVAKNVTHITFLIDPDRSKDPTVTYTAVDYTIVPHPLDKKRKAVIGPAYWTPFDQRT